jgi:hypothetical protein
MAPTAPRNETIQIADRLFNAQRPTNSANDLILRGTEEARAGVYPTNGLVG